MLEREGGTLTGSGLSSLGHPLGFPNPLGFSNSLGFSSPLRRDSR
jgi:hypothetical protein